MDDGTVKKLQAQAKADLARDIARAEAALAADPPQADRRLFAFELGKLRVKQGLSQAELACRAGLRQSDISRLENCKANPTLESLTAIARALDACLVLECKK